MSSRGWRSTEREPALSEANVDFATCVMFWDLRKRGSTSLRTCPTIGTGESHNRSFFACVEFWYADANCYLTECYDFVWTRGTAIAIASTAHKDFESN
jgi:hypothetical protein